MLFTKLSGLNRTYSLSFIFLDGIALAAQATPPIHSVVCLSVVCHICAPCLNRSTDLDAI